MKTKRDKEKLTDWVNNFNVPELPEMQSDEIKEIGRIGIEYIDKVLHGMLKEIEKI